MRNMQQMKHEEQKNQPINYDSSVETENGRKDLDLQFSGKELGFLNANLCKLSLKVFLR